MNSQRMTCLVCAAFALCIVHCGHWPGFLMLELQRVHGGCPFVEKAFQWLTSKAFLKFDDILQFEGTRFTSDHTQRLAGFLLVNYAHHEPCLVQAAFAASLLHYQESRQSFPNRVDAMRLTFESRVVPLSCNMSCFEFQGCSTDHPQKHTFLSQAFRSTPIRVIVVRKGEPLL